MKLILRFAILLPLSLYLSLCNPVHASSIDENLPDAQALAQLELRAQQAGPRDQCFLYTELVHTMTEIAGRQMLDGDVDKASDTLKNAATVLCLKARSSSSATPPTIPAIASSSSSSCSTPATRRSRISSPIHANRAANRTPTSSSSNSPTSPTSSTTIWTTTAPITATSARSCPSSSTPPSAGPPTLNSRPKTP